MFCAYESGNQKISFIRIYNKRCKRFFIRKFCDKFEKIAYIFKQLQDTNRVRLFWLLCHCEECVINISALLNMSSPAISHHLRLLRSSGLITSRREGKEVYYKAADTKQSKLLHQMIEQVIEISCPK